ncbi:MAG: dihydropteroate synthase [Prosthecobacter sp.]|nr:dihydropteroate synthase [Prosthecobacter sp.]
MIWKARHHVIEFPRRPLVMGIVNINDDSFCGDGTLDPEKALAQAEGMLRDGADIIDIGAESARTNRGPISETEEIERLLPFMAAWADLIAKFETSPWDKTQLWPPLLSINTWRSAVIEAVLPHGGDLINDISALPDATNARLCAEHGASLLIMHSIGQPKVPHTHVGYANILETMAQFFDEKMALAQSAGLASEYIILDPGIDFAKQREDNLKLYRHADQIQHWGRPVLLPVSRKTVIGQVLDLPQATDRDAGTIACINSGMRQGSQIFRVHNVRAAAQAVKVLWGLR